MTAIWAEQALLAGGWARDVTVRLDGDRIAGVATGTARPPEAVPAGVLLPAPTNLHSHAFQRAMAGLTERRGPDPRDSFWTWRRLMFRFLERIAPEDVEALAALVQMEALEAGFAAVAEFHYLHHGPGGAPYADLGETSARVAAAAAATGIGLTLLPVLYERGGCDGRPLEAGQDRFGNDLDRFARLLESAEGALRPLPADARLGVAPHSLRAVRPESLQAAAALRPDGPLHMHLAEQTAEVEEVRAHLGARPVEWLLAQAEVDARWCLIHCTQMEPAEVAGLAATGAVAGLCPITEASLGDGIFEGAAYLGAGGRWGVGSDSNVRVALGEELRGLEHSQRLRDRGRAVLATPERSTGRVLLEGAASGGAQAAGRAAGAIAPGLLADLVALDAGALALAGLKGDAVLDAWIFAGDDRLVRDVWSAGRHVVEAGRHRGREAILAAARRTLLRLREA